MAKTVVDSGVMREKAQTIEEAATKIQTLFSEMLNEVNKTAQNMKGNTIDTQKQQFAGMQTTFDTFVNDMKSYSTFLKDAAEEYEKAEQEGTQKASEQGKVF